MSIVTKTFIRRADREDLDLLVRWMEDEDFQYFLYGDPARSPRLIRDQIVGYLSKTAGSPIPGSVYFIVDSPNGPIGMISLQNISWRNRSCNLDVYISPQHRGHLSTGINVYRALEYAFDELNMHRVSAIIYAFNQPSWRLLEFLGAKREVTLKDHILRNGIWHDVFVYGLLKQEFNVWREKYAEQSKEVTLQKMIESMKCYLEKNL
ncbi:MAG TPA: GNAT family protein [Candidatus Hydrogenedens sp.]|nr:GNAT family protein [Candidatus Hydrogenedens sp.]HOL18941.1 GNAT family protein [Candidatus Hydrogenedens sp.]HPP59007.1 GNAT family protein [Candidatus Hydrogenedens sp.]